MLTTVLLIAGAAWWILACTLILSGPILVFLAFVICTTIYPCSPDHHGRRAPVQRQEVPE
jgi:hypothetical protein